ncbi:hypothetical protein VTP01DRAFT_392 [Rhizomucor pusillus]|uniref:uncharacterized protein n=1 Tax=Rhizomucor pusillus TaxID=4840 RepID=UPI0037429D21
MASLLLPAAYLGGCVATMSVFSFFYRRAKNVNTVEPWFPRNEAKEQYITLLNTKDQLEEQHLKAALLRRAMEAVQRVLTIQREKPAMQQLLRGGYIGEDVWQDLMAAEEEVMAEMQSVAQEANTFANDWSKTIFTTAAQMLEAEKQQELKRKMEERKAYEEKRRAIELQIERMEDEVLAEK